MVIAAKQAKADIVMHLLQIVHYSIQQSVQAFFMLFNLKKSIMHPILTGQLTLVMLDCEVMLISALDGALKNAGQN